MARSSRPLRRKPGTATEAETIAIVCEGKKTEGLYFNGIRREFRIATAQLKVMELGFDPLRLVQEAESFQRNYDQVWAVFDVEAPGAHAIPHARLNQALDRAARTGIRCAVSNPCFELWLLLHFQAQTAYVNNEAVRQKIRKCPCGYDDKSFEFAKVWPHHGTALRNAESLDARQVANGAEIPDRNPWTSVHELVTQLLKLARAGR
ncbi:RloB family protein [Actinoplanes sp. HUAS TT8]|uniref:RloB family protein n=1 Tax=Actinoplanes sp. HUAS TT8 TaxID=3447453 RepID=UPI003F5249DD